MHMAIGSFTSSHGCYQLPWLKAFILLHLLIQCIGTQISYSDHCASVVPESTRTDPEFASLPFRPIQSGYYNGGDRILNPDPSNHYSNNNNILLFETHRVRKTDVEGVLNIEGNLNLYSLYSSFSGYGMSYSRSVFSRLRTGDDSALSFRLKGFWSKSNGKLCMVGSSSSYSREGNLLHHPAVIKLNGVKNSSTITSLVTGTLRSLSPADDPSYFEPIPLLIFPDVNYQYTRVSEEFKHECSGEIDIPEENSFLGLRASTTICSILERPANEFELEYALDCNSTKNCNPFGDSIGYLPQIMSLKIIHCSPDGQSLRFLGEFPNSSYVGYYSNFNPKTTFVAEGSWDWKKNRLCVFACRIFSTNGFLDNSHVEDCSIRMTLRFPAIWSIRETTSILGQIWSNKTVNNSGFFERLVLRNTDYDDMLRVVGLKYEYKAIEKVRNISCLKKPVGKRLGKYPDGTSNEMNFDMSVKIRGAKIAWGYLVPISVGDQISPSTNSARSWSSSGIANSGVEANASNSRPLNISYRIRLTPYYFAKTHGVNNLFNISSGRNRRVEIVAEGIYDAQTGRLCMVGCRCVGLKYHKLSNDSMDCEILVHLQFPPLDIRKGGVHITGNIASSRNKSDALYFDPLSFSATSFYRIIERQSIWRMDAEILMVLISNTLACVIVGFQILYVKKHPDVLPFISLLMLVVLTLGNMMLLVLNFEALFFQSHTHRTLLLGSGGWLEAHEVIVRVVTMVALLLQFRLLQLSLFKRLGDANTGKSLWVAEKKALFLSLPLYLAGAIITLFASYENNQVGIAKQSFWHSNDLHHSLWADLRSYAGLILDSFLFPQILLNIFHNSRENALSRIFYIGFTIVRSVPHAYDLYRAHNYDQNFDGSFIFADPAADLYSTAWDVTIPFVGLLFAAIIYFQQRFGGRCFLPRRFRELEVYQKVPEASEE